jgi:hypothetical protein
MTQRYDVAYKIKRGDNLGDPDLWNGRFQDLDLRIHARELDADRINEAADELVAAGLQRLDQTFTPLINDAQTAASNTETIVADAQAALAELQHTIDIGIGGANPTGLAGLTPVNGSANTYMRSDGAPAINQGIAPTWTSPHTFAGAGSSIILGQNGGNTGKLEFRGSTGGSYTITAFTNGSSGVSFVGQSNFSGLNMTGDAVLETGHTFRLQDADNSAFVGLKAPSTVSTTYTLTFPPNAGAAGQVLMGDGSGGLSWFTLPTPPAFAAIAASGSGADLVAASVPASKLANGAAAGNLGFNPVQQGGGAGQGNNKVYIGWAADGSGVKCTIDVTDQGRFLFDWWIGNQAKYLANQFGLLEANQIWAAANLREVFADGNNNVRIDFSTGINFIYNRDDNGGDRNIAFYGLGGKPGQTGIIMVFNGGASVSWFTSGQTTNFWLPASGAPPQNSGDWTMYAYWCSAANAAVIAKFR